MADEVTTVIKGRYTYSIISMTAYLLGVPKRIFENEYEPPKMEVYEQLEKDKNARIVRNLCRLRNAFEQNYKTISERMIFEYKSIMTIQEVPNDALMQLAEDGISIVRSKNTLPQYIMQVNRVLMDRINNCKQLYPIWLNWQYIRDIFIMPDGLTDKGIKAAADLYYEKKSYYPYQVYMNWPAEDNGNIFYHDQKFVTLLYEWNEDEFRDLSKVSDVSDYTKSSIYDFVDGSQKTIIVVDCENSDPYKLCAVLRSLSKDTLEKIVKIMLFDDIHTASAWSILEYYVKIPVEHIMIERIKQNKSLVDIRLTAGACREFYRNQVESFVIVSSDSDYWGLISSMPDARFLVMIEREKCGPDMKEALMSSGIFYCYIDDFYSGNNDDIKITALVRAAKKYLEQSLQLNVQEMMDTVFLTTRVNISDAEKQQFYNRYIKPMQLVIGEDGEVTIQLRGK